MEKNSMQGRLRHFILISFLIVAVSTQLAAQVDSVANKKAITDCEATLAVATGEFNAGRFFSLPSILKGCLDKGFTNEQKIRAYILLCQVYLINDNPAEAENSYLKLLEANPEYIATPEIDPIDVVFLSKKFTTRPVFTPHVKGGVNTTFVTILHNASTNTNPQMISSNYQLNPGINVGGGMDWNPSDRISLAGDLMFATRKFSKTVNGIYSSDRSDRTTTLTWIDVPIYLKYQDYLGSFRPYGYLGYAMHMKLGASSELTYVNIDDAGGQGTERPTEGTAVKIGYKQYFLNRSLVFGGGIKYKIGKNYIFADLRVQLGQTNVTKPSKIMYGNGSNEIDIDVLKYNVVNDLYRVNSISVSMGYIFPVYSPRKKGGWQPKGLLGKFLYGKSNSVSQ